MHTLVEQLKKEDSIEVEQLEVWHNEDNMKKLEEYDKDYCGGVPFFYNTKTGKYICGEGTLEELREWSQD